LYCFALNKGLFEKEIFFISVLGLRPV